MTKSLSSLSFRSRLLLALAAAVAAVAAVAALGPSASLGKSSCGKTSAVNNTYAVWVHGVGCNQAKTLVKTTAKADGGSHACATRYVCLTSDKYASSGLIYARQDYTRVVVYNKVRG